MTDSKPLSVIFYHNHVDLAGMRRTYIADFIVGGTPDSPELSVGGELIPCMVAK